MGIIRNFLDSRAVRNAVKQHDGFRGYSDSNSSQLNSYNGYETDVYTRNIDYNHFFDGINKGGKYDNYYGDYSRIIQVAPTYPLYFVDNNDDIEEGTDFVKYLEKPNEDYPQFKVLQQIYSELQTKGYSEIFLWRKNGKDDTRIFDAGKLYDKEDFRGITLVSGYKKDRLSKLDKQNIIRINLGVSQTNVFMGYSPSQAAQSWRKMQDEMGLHMTAFAKNAGMPIGKFIITAPTPEDYAKMREKLDDKISGAKNNGKVLYDYRPADSKVTQIEWVQFTSQDVQDYTAQLEFAEKKMSQSFGVPGTVKGTNDGENYATARVSEHIFIKYTIKSLIDDFKAQFEYEIEARFDLKGGKIKVNIPLPEIADETLVKIQATTQQVTLFDQKIEEGYTAESIVAAYDLPERFLLLEKTTASNKGTNNSIKASEKPKNALHSHAHEDRNEFEREYQNALTAAERKDIESKFEQATKEYTSSILSDGMSEAARAEYEGKMVATFSEQYSKLYNKSVEDVADSLADILDSVDVSDLELTSVALASAAALYAERVADFSKSFAEGIEALAGETLEVREKNSIPHIKRVVVTESEHTRIVSELGAWTKAQEDFPVRVYKTWNARSGACEECIELDKTKIDVTALFAGRGDDSINEIYEIQGGGLHPSCRCSVQYEMEKA